MNNGEAVCLAQSCQPENGTGSHFAVAFVIDLE